MHKLRPTRLITQVTTLFYAQISMLSLDVSRQRDFCYLSSVLVVVTGVTNFFSHNLLKILLKIYQNLHKSVRIEKNRGAIVLTKLIEIHIINLI